MRRWPFRAPQFMTSLGRMLGLAWQAQPMIFLSLILLTALQGVVPLITAWITKLLFDLLVLVLQGGGSVDLARNLALLILVQAVVFTVSQMITPASRYLNEELGRKLTVVVETAVYKKIGSFSGIAYFENPGFYDTFRLASQGARFGPLQGLHILTTLFQSTITLLAFLGTLIAFNPLLAALVGLAALPQLWLELKLGRQRFGLAFELSPGERRAFYYGYLLSDGVAAKEIRLFDLVDHFLNGLLSTYRKIHEAQRRQDLRELQWKLPLEALSALVFSAAFGVVAIQAFVGRLSLGDVTLYVNAVRSLQGALSSMVVALADLNEQALFFKQYDHLMALPQPVWIARSSCPIPALTSGIELRRVSFRYGEQHPWVLRNLDLYIPAGKCLSIVGLNGVGKTTLVKLLTRLYDPTEGQILWDGIDIREFDPEDLRRRTGLIFQDFMHYAFTAQENIGLGKVEFLNDLALIQQAAVKAGVHEAIQNLPQGYQTMLSRIFGEETSGAELSEGEWQKVALARLFMRQADMLILDEPTAALDAQAEYEIYNRFTELVRGRTCLLISHRFSTVRMADVIAVLDEGRIMEYGSHDTLCSLGGIYARLYNMQAERYR